MRVVCLQNMPQAGLGRCERLLAAAGHQVRLVAAYDGATLPGIQDADAVIVGGSPLAAYDWERRAFLRDEAAFLRAAAAAGTPCLGVCFGAQFLAHLLGGRAYRADRAEIGAHTVRLTEAGRSDPAVAGFPPSFPVFHWHHDSFDLPSGAVLLATADGVRHQMYRLGRVVGVQFHPEVTPADVAAWAAAGGEELREVGKTAAQAVAECAALDADLERLAERLLGNFLVPGR